MLISCNYCSDGSVIAFLVAFKGRVQCFSMQIVINKCFVLHPKKI